MRTYRCYLTGPTGHYVRRFEYQAGDDPAALNEGRSLLLSGAPQFPGAEVWEDERFVGAWQRGPAPASGRAQGRSHGSPLH